MSSPPESQALAHAGPAGLAIVTDPRLQLPPHLKLIDEAVVEAIWRAPSAGA